MWFKIGSYFLGSVFKFRKILVAGLAVGLVGSALWFGLDAWHFEPLKNRAEEIASIKKELTVCRNRATDEFVTENRSVFDAYREEIQEMEDEEIIVDELNGSNYDWMYE